MENIILGGGCFWCVEAAFENCEGIVHTEVGYTGGGRIILAMKVFAMAMAI